MLRYNGDESSDGAVPAVLSQTTTLESFTPCVCSYGLPSLDAYATSVQTVCGFAADTTPHGPQYPRRSVNIKGWGKLDGDGEFTHACRLA